MSDHLAGPRRPLFVTRFGLSDRTAIGAQTRHLLAHFPEHLHLYWHESVFDRRQPGSERIENPLLGRLTPLKRDSRLARRVAGLTGGRWDGDVPGAALSRRLAGLNGTVSSIYLAPIEERDSRRMMEIARRVDRPFVLHLWDFLDDGAQAPATRWLITEAAHVFCLNEQILDEVRPLQPNATLLPFRRDATPQRARPRSATAPKPAIAILGDIGSYLDGVRSLLEAVVLAERAGAAYDVLYVGAAKMLRRAGIGPSPRIRATGFLETPAARDAALAGCSVGFLPGPTAAPSQSTRSRFSIPSRVLDLMAVGLPVVGTVHPDSATFSYCRGLGIGGALHGTAPERVAASLAELYDPVHWAASSRRSTAAFASHAAAHDLSLLSALMTGNPAPTHRPAAP